MASDFKCFIDKYADYYYVNNTGDLISCKRESRNNGKYTYTKIKTGIKNPTSGGRDYFVDQNGVLWNYSRRDQKATKKAENAAWVGYRRYEGIQYDECVCIMNDGTVYLAGTSNEVYLPEEEKQGFLSNGILQFDRSMSGAGSADVTGRLPHYHIAEDHTLYIIVDGKKAAITNAETVIGGEQLPDGSKVIWFIRTDGSIWRYHCGSTQFTEEVKSTQSELVKGDANGDGAFDVSDIVILQKWLLSVNETKLTNWKAADLYADDRLDVFDLAIMKRELLCGENNV